MRNHLLAGTVIGLAMMGAGCASNDAVPYTPPVTPSTTDTLQIIPETSTTSTAPLPPTATSTTSTTNPVTTTPVTKTPLAFPGILPAAEVNKKILIKTTKGDITIQIDRELGPRAASNFVYLVKNHFYDGLIFHRVIPGFMIQGGDPTGTGTSGPGYQFDNDPVNVPYNDGVVAMANAGPNTNGSQFFIMVSNVPLQPDYSVFGRVISGLDVAHKIADVSRDVNDRPDEDVKMTSVTILP